MNETALLDSARGGDEDAFAQLLAPYRVELHAHCYRMLGSVHDAEDALQEALLRAWRGLARFEGRSSLRSWLYRIATNACLRAIERRPERVLPIDYGPPGDPHQELAVPLSESVWIEPYADEEDGPAAPDARYERRESVELAFVAALQHLPARQRAVLILRDVLGFSAREVAETLDSSPASIDSALQRAHKSVEQRLPQRSQQATLRELGDKRLSALVGGYVDAWERSDIDAVVAMLTHDARITMPPIPTWYRGRDAVRTFLSERVLAGDRPRRLLPVRANGAQAFGQYFWDEPSGRLLPHGITVLTLRGAEIEEMTAFLTPDAFARFGLPAELAS
ncbi:MAG: sigma-70 family RNA polymerase sigma factor [Solirubrobacteraceae bacterium]